MDTHLIRVAIGHLLCSSVGRVGLAALAHEQGHQWGVGHCSACRRQRNYFREVDLTRVARNVFGTGVPRTVVVSCLEQRVHDSFVRAAA